MMFENSGESRFQKDLERLQLVFLTLAAMACAHLLLFNLRSVLMPFVLSGFLVAAVEPSAEILYNMLAGLAPPYRWCCCFCRRLGASDSFRSSPSSMRGYGTLSPNEARRDSNSNILLDGDEENRLPLLDKDGRRQDADVLWESICKMLAVFLTVCAIMLVVICFVLLLIQGALHLQDSWPAYRSGLKGWIAWFDSVAGSVAKSFNMDKSLEVKVKAVYNNILVVVQDTIYAGVSWLAQSMTSGLATMAVVVLYVLLWLSRPLPMGGNTGVLVRSYIWKKTLTSCCYGFSVTLLFLVMGCDLAYFFGLISFFLNYVPEVGAAFSILVPVPVILLDGRLTAPVFYSVMAMVGQLLLKLIIANLLEVKLVEQDAEMSIHPVWVFLGLNYFGYIWGPAGMLVSVPVLAIIKSAALSALQSEEEFSHGWVRNFLVCLEGRPGAIHGLFMAFAPTTTELHGSCCACTPPLSPKSEVLMRPRTAPLPFAPPPQVARPDMAKAEAEAEAEAERASGPAAAPAPEPPAPPAPVGGVAARARDVDAAAGG